MELHLIQLEQNSLLIQDTSNSATDRLWHLNSNNADARATLKMCCILETICAPRYKKGFTGFWQQNLRHVKKTILLNYLYANFLNRTILGLKIHQKY